MNAPVDTLAFAERFESVGFAHEQARVLAAAFGQARDGVREDLVTKADLDLWLTEFEARFAKQFSEADARFAKQFSEADARMAKQFSEADARVAKQFGEFEARFAKQFSEADARVAKQFGEFEARIAKQLGDMEVRLTRQAGEIGRDATGRLWSAVTIIGGVATAVAAAISGGVAILLKSGGL